MRFTETSCKQNKKATFLADDNAQNNVVFGSSEAVWLNELLRCVVCISDAGVAHAEFTAVLHIMFGPLSSLWSPFLYLFFLFFVNIKTCMRRNAQKVSGESKDTKKVYT